MKVISKKICSAINRFKKQYNDEKATKHLYNSLKFAFETLPKEFEIKGGQKNYYTNTAEFEIRGNIDGSPENITRTLDIIILKEPSKIYSVIKNKDNKYKGMIRDI